MCDRNPAVFYGPRLTSWLVWLVQRLAEPLGRRLYWVDLVLSQADHQVLAALAQERVILLPNHPTFQDPIVMFLLSARVNQAFHYLAALETFTNPHAMVFMAADNSFWRILLRLMDEHTWCFRNFLQRLGLYSVRRGLADRASIAQTLALLQQSQTHLVIFPEGGCSFQNDTVMPFRAGGIQLAFQALNRCAKQDRPLPDLYVLPVAIKYVYTEDMQPVIEATLQRLEQALALDDVMVSTPDAYTRLRRIAEAVLGRLEQEYDQHRPEATTLSLDDRITHLKQAVLDACEAQLGLSAAPETPVRERVYRIQHALRNGSDSEPSELFFSPESVEKATARLLNFDAICDGYVAANPTPERFLDTLIRLEREVFEIDQPPPKGHRQAILRLGTPINLKDAFADYCQDRTATVERLTNQAQAAVQAMLDGVNGGKAGKREG
ncbi:hypothetical protein XM38_044950 [Halomicronema hongdechloris C2206]|uniref:Phospholipid/glycerol acyltransferase domain-containing protein n=1 Tax=Halomicronema hongdechloris C2206 TaxID=1641165 RepID=A0A1Z3HT91_9CYAN|nr:1-acyl-sn-glycerol-3-phosphate acyltransferase [Halomicronema hongdechloris]ASC73528.1 hypothetical protein XM38_044950 [Halomicronema hongdechloris C2206]